MNNQYLNVLILISLIIVLILNIVILAKSDNNHNEKYESSGSSCTPTCDDICAFAPVDNNCVKNCHQKVDAGGYVEDANCNELQEFKEGSKCMNDNCQLGKCTDVGKGFLTCK